MRGGGNREEEGTKFRCTSANGEMRICFVSTSCRRAPTALCGVVHQTKTQDVQHMMSQKRGISSANRTGTVGIQREVGVYEIKQ